MSEPAVHPLTVILQNSSVRFSQACERNERKILVLAATGFVTLFSLLGAWKLWSFGYNGLDLAIYRQVMTNSIHGHLFGFTIHPGSFLGDHLEVIIVPLLAVFAAAPFPLTLIILQAIALAIAIFPLSKILSKVVGKPWHLLFALAYLANPVIQNTAVFEFHILPFAVPVVCFALLFFVEKHFWRFIVFCLLAVLVREDVGLIVVGFGLWAMIERRSSRWSIFPTVLGVAWLAAALMISAHLNGLGHYKFLAYYGWLGNSVTAIITNAITHPWIVVGHLLSSSNLKFLLIFLMPFAFLPVLRSRWLIPTSFSLLQLLLLPLTGVLITQIHYPVLLVPFFVVAMAAGWKKVSSAPKQSFLNRFGGTAPVTAIVSLFVLYGMFTLGPIAQAIPIIVSSRSISDRVHLERDLVQNLPAGPTVASYEQLTALADHSNLYSLHYLFLGHKQFSSAAYTLPANTSVIIMDMRDFLMYQLEYPTSDISGKDGYSRLRTMLMQNNFTVTSFIDRFVILEKNPNHPPINDFGQAGRPVTVYGTPSVHGELSFLGWSSPSGTIAVKKINIGKSRYTVIPVSLTFKKTTDGNAIRPVEFDITEYGKNVYHEVLPLGGGILPTSDWQTGHSYTSHYNLLIPKTLQEKPLHLSARVMDVDGAVILNGLRSLSIHYSRYAQLGPVIDLGDFTP